MLPREQSLLAGGLSFYMNDTTGTPQFWPETVTADSQHPVCSFANATDYPICPSSGYESLSQTLTSSTYTGCGNAIHLPGEFDGVGFTPVCQARGVEGNREWYSYLIQSGASARLIPPMLNGVRHGPGWASNGTVAIQPHAATVLKMQELRRWWWMLVIKFNTPRTRQYRWSYDMETHGSATSPSVRTSCSFAQNISADSLTAAFPYLLRPHVDKNGLDEHTKQRLEKTGLGINDWAGNHFKQSSIVALNRSHSSHIRTQWVSLPMEDFGDTLSGTNVTGMLVELPWLNDSRLAIGCSVAAAWHNGTVRSERASNYAAFSIIMSGNDFGARDDSPTSELSNRPVTLSDGWLALLTAPSPESPASSSNRSMNTLESILHGSFYANLTNDLRAIPGICGGQVLNATELNLSDAELWALPKCAGVGHEYLELILATMVADGLSRYGSHHAINTTGELRQWRPLTVPNFNRTHVFTGEDPRTSAEAAPGLFPQWFEVYVVGYSYYPNKKSDWISLAGICAYLLLVVCHILYGVYQVFRKTKTTSDAWDTVTELLVLCQNSQPPNISKKLENTTAGIERWKTYNSIVKVRAFPGEDGGKHQLRLVLDDDAASIYQGQVALSRSGSSGSSAGSAAERRDNNQDTQVSQRDVRTGSTPPSHGMLGQSKRFDRVQVDQEYS